MERSHAAGWGPDAPDPAQLKEFFAQIESGRITHGRLQALLMGETPSMALTDVEQVALGILGTGKVLGFRNVICVWNAGLPEAEPVMPFSEDILRECAEANAQGTADWRLAYALGLSLRQQQEIRGWNRKKPPCFNPDVKWWLESQQDFWAIKTVEPGYRLYNFAKMFANLHWDVQEEKIAELGNQFERAEEQAVTEICFSSYQLNGKEYLLPDWYHWGKLRASGGCRVCVGRSGHRGFGVRDYWDGGPHGSLAVVLSRKAA